MKRLALLVVSVVLLVTLLSSPQCACGHPRRIHRYGGRGWNFSDGNREVWLLPTCPSCLEKSVGCFWLSGKELNDAARASLTASREIDSGLAFSRFYWPGEVKDERVWHDGRDDYT